jgi:hypothetical protein
MKFLQSLPGKEDFFKSYVRLTKSIGLAGIIAQIVSAATEVTILYALSHQAVAPILPAAAPYVAALVAVLGVVLIEGGLRVTAPQAADAVLHRRFDGLHLVMSVTTFAVVVLLGIASGWLSFTNSTAIVEGLSESRFEALRMEADTAAAARKSELAATWSADSAALDARHAAIIASAQLAADARAAAARTELENIERREARTGKSYATKKDAARAALAATLAEDAAALAALHSTRESEMLAARQAYREAVLAADARHGEALASIQAQQDGTIAKYGGQLGYFTIVCLIVFFAATVLQRVHAKGSEVAEEVELSQYDVSPHWFINLREALAERFNYAVMSRIVAFANNTPPPPPPPNPHAVYDPTQIADTRARLEVEAPEDDEEDVIRIQPKRRQIGFNPPSVNNATVSNASSGGSLKNCLQCGAGYTAKVNWQKFCSPGCKDTYHASKHGGNAFDPQAYHTAKKRKK